MTLNFTKEAAGLPSSLPIVGFINKPVYVLLSVVGAVFVLEALVMLLLMYLPPLTAYQEVFLDSSLLSTIVFPAIRLSLSANTDTY